MAKMGLPVTFRALNRYYWDWVNQRLPVNGCQDTTGIVALRGEQPVAAVIMDNWTHTSCTVHWVLEDPLVLRHGLIQEACEYVFKTAGRRIMIGVMPESNTKAYKIARHIGFSHIYQIKDGSDEGDDTLVLEMRKENCRWLKQSDAA